MSSRFRPIQRLAFSTVFARRYTLLAIASAHVLGFTTGAWAGEFWWPTSGTITGLVGDDRGDHLHAGVDIAASSGTNIYAACEGTIAFRGWYDGYGNTIDVRHGGGWVTRYAHQSSFASGTYVGKHVNRGEHIGNVGNTGTSYGAHLHFEVREGITFGYGDVASIPCSRYQHVTVKTAIRNYSGTTCGEPPPEDDAAFDDSSIPDFLDPGETREVWVLFKNTGDTTWTKAKNYFLKAIGESDPFANVWHGLDADNPIVPGEKRRFQFYMYTTPTTPRVYNTNWRMWNGTKQKWFGDTLEKTVTVIWPLTTVFYDSFDSYDNQAQFQSVWTDTGNSAYRLDTAEFASDPDHRATIRMPSPLEDGLGRYWINLPRKVYPSNGEPVVFIYDMNLGEGGESENWSGARHFCELRGYSGGSFGAGDLNNLVAIGLNPKSGDTFKPDRYQGRVWKPNADYDNTWYSLNADPQAVFRKPGWKRFRIEITENNARFYVNSQLCERQELSNATSGKGFDSIVLGSNLTANGRRIYVDNVRVGIAGAPPRVTAQPVARRICPGQQTTFTIQATGGGAFFQWQKNGNDLSNGGHYSDVHTRTLKVSNASSADAGNYRCVVKNAAGQATSQAAALTLLSGTPTISQHPTARSVCLGARTSFTVAGSGCGSLTYRWQRNGADLSNNAHYSGVSSSTLTIMNAGSEQAGNYRCVVANGSGTVTSNSAALAVRTAATVVLGSPSRTTSSGESVSFPVTYAGADSVSLSASHITLLRTGTANAIVAVSGSGTTSRTVTLGKVTGTGTLRISIAAGSATVAGCGAAPAAGPSSAVTVENAPTSPPILAHVWGDQFEDTSAWTAATDYTKLNFISGVTRVDDGTGSAKQPAGEARFMYHQLSDRPFHTCEVTAYARELEFGYSGNCDMAYRSMVHLRDPSGGVADAKVSLGYAASINPANFFCQVYGRRNQDGLDDTGMGNLGKRNEVGTCWADKWVQFKITVNDDDIALWSSNAGATDRQYKHNGQNVVRPAALTSKGMGRIYLGQSGVTPNDIWWDSVQFYGFVPGEPVNMAGSAMSTSQITWQAEPSNTDYFGFEVFDEAAGQSLHVSSATTRTTNLNWTETGLAANTSYSRYAKCWNGSLNSLRSSEASVYTHIEAPTGVSFGEVTTATIDVFPEGNLSNLEAGQSGVRITNLTTGADSGFQQHAGGATFDGLAPNTAYSFVARARNGDEIETADSSPVTQYTLSIPPDEQSVQLITATPCPGENAAFAASGGFGPGTVQYYRYAWDQNPSYEFEGAEPQWSADNLDLPVNGPGSWYLHVQGLNGDDVANGTFDYAIDIPDADGDGAADCLDGCVDDPDKVEPGVCGCGTADLDTDSDGLPDCVDDCPTTIAGVPVDESGCPPHVHGDLDRDGDVDGDDLMALEACWSGPTVPHEGGQNCVQIDADQDDDVDQLDFGVFQRCLSGSDVPADPACFQ